MKFNPFAWTEVNINEEVKAPQGELQLRVSAPSAIFITAEGHEVLAGFGTSLTVTCSEEMTFRVETAKGVRAFIYQPFVETFEPEGEVFSNADRMPHESGTMAEITKGLRMFKLEQREIMGQIQAARFELEQRQAAALEPSAPPSAALDPAAE
ncbi:MAG: hypothetical protein [Microviridae sp.]|nr:MAG: hypothetical protein [Microviridae sp.]